MGRLATLTRAPSRDPDEMLQAALGYADRGWPVFPCDPATKRPFTGRGFKDASTDPDVIARWWRRRPDAMIGVPMGERSGVFAIDPDAPDKPDDPDGRAAWSGLAARHGGAPATHTHATPSGGQHLVFRWRPDCPVTNREGALAGTGINVRGEGGYLVVPPSVMADGRRYAMADDRHWFEFADAPAWLHDMIAGRVHAPAQKAGDGVEHLSAVQGRAANDSRQDRYAEAALNGEADRVATSGNGSRNNTLNASAFRLGTLVGAGALDASRARDRLLAAATDCGLVQEDGRRAVLATIESGMTSGAASPREMPEEPARRGRRTKRPRPDASPPDDDLPVIRVVAGELPRVVEEAEAALIGSGLPVFSRAGALVRPITDTIPAAHGRTTTIAKFKEVCPDTAVDLLSRVARFERFDVRSDDWATIDPPAKVASVFLAREGEWRVPRAVGIITTPTLRPDGSVLSAPGYDPATRLYLAPGGSLRLPELPAKPTREDADGALMLLADLLSGFPFVGPVDRAVALSGIVTAVTRGAMAVAPLHAIRAHSAGTGKSYLVDIASMIATGRLCPVIAAGKTEEETEKRLGALLRDAVPIISIDNVNGELGGDALCQMTERPLVRIRILGKTETPEFECKATVFATGNNLTLIGDMTRRTILCSLDAGVERPELREFTSDPVAMVAADRGRYVAAALTIAMAYRAAGSPKVCEPIGSYGEWSETVRAPLIWLGEADPVVSMETARDEDPELAAIRELHGYWTKHLSEVSPYTTNAIIQAAVERESFNGYGSAQGDFKDPEFRDLLLRVAGDGGAVSSRRLGKWLSRISGKIVDRRRVTMRADGSNGNKFSLSRADDAATTMEASHAPHF